MKYKVGDAVKVIRNCDSDVNVGEIGTIIEIKRINFRNSIFSFPYKAEFKTTNNEKFYEVFSEEEIELVKLNKFKAGDIVRVVVASRYRDVGEIGIIKTVAQMEFNNTQNYVEFESYCFRNLKTHWFADRELELANTNKENN